MKTLASFLIAVVLAGCTTIIEPYKKPHRDPGDESDTLKPCPIKKRCITHSDTITVGGERYAVRHVADTIYWHKIEN